MTHFTKQISERMLAAKERIRLEHPEPDYPIKVPEYRRRIVVEDFDYGYRKVVLELYDSGRIDSYTVVENGQVIEWRKGFARVLNLLLDRFKRVSAV